MSDVRYGGTSNYCVTTATMDNLRKCYGSVKQVPRISHGSLRLCYEFATVLYGIAGSDRVKPRYHYGVDGMLRFCNGSATVSTEREALDRLCVRLNMYLVITEVILLTRSLTIVGVVLLL